MGAMVTSALALVGNSKSGTISTLRVAEGSLDVVCASPVGVGCGTFAVDPSRDLVYSAVKEPEPAIVTLQLDRDTGQLTERARRTVPNPLAYLELNPEASVLLGASYDGGWGATWPLEDGTLGDEVSRVEHANLHAVITDGDFAYFVSLGDDLIDQQRLGQDGTLSPLEPATVSVDEGAGARHLIFGRDGSSAYLMTEFTGQAIRFDRDPSGRLTPAEAVDAHDPDSGLKVSEFGADPKENHLIWGADLHLTADGRFLICSERTISTLASIRLDSDGRLLEVAALTPTEKQPRGFNVTPDGRHLLVAGEASGQVSLHRVEDDGSLPVEARVATGYGPNWVRFV